MVVQDLKEDQQDDGVTTSAIGAAVVVYLTSNRVKWNEMTNKVTRGVRWQYRVAI